MLLLRTKVRLGSPVRLLNGYQLTAIAAFQMCEGAFYLGRHENGKEYTFTLDQVNPSGLPAGQPLIEFAFFPGQQVTLSNKPKNHDQAVVVAAVAHIDKGKLYLVQSPKGVEHVLENDVSAYNSEKIPKFLESFSTLADEPDPQETAKG